MTDFLSGSDFLQLAEANKVQLIDTLAAQMLAVGCKAAEASANYYRVYLTDKSSKDVPMLRSIKEQYDAEYDTLKHVVSALQSTLKAEREMIVERAT